jgi:hypothetical protein
MALEDTETDVWRCALCCIMVVWGRPPRLSSASSPTQVPDEEKRRKADFVIDTGSSLADTEAQVLALTAELRQEGGGAAARRARRR